MTVQMLTRLHSLVGGGSFRIIIIFNLIQFLKGKERGNFEASKSYRNFSTKPDKVG